MVADVAGGPASCWAAVQTQLSLAVGHTVEVCHNLELELFSMCTAGERRLFVERDSSRHRALRFVQRLEAAAVRACGCQF